MFATRIKTTGVWLGETFACHCYAKHILNCVSFFLNNRKTVKKPLHHLLKSYDPSQNIDSLLELI